jgi:hypothetical protein
VRSLQTVAMGLIIVFVDVGSGGWDWVTDPVGWVLVLLGLAPVKERLPAYPGVVISAWVCLVVSVLTLPPDSVDMIDPTLGWLFSLPTLAFCFLLCDSLADVTDGGLAVRLRLLRFVFILLAVLPGLVYLGGLEWLTIPAAVVAVVANVTLVLSSWSAGDEDEEEWKLPDRDSRSKPVAPPVGSEATEPAKRKVKDQGFDAEEVRRRARARRSRGE